MTPISAAKVIWLKPNSDDAVPARSGKGVMAPAMADGSVRPMPAMYTTIGASTCR